MPILSAIPAMSQMACVSGASNAELRQDARRTREAAILALARQFESFWWVRGYVITDHDSLLCVIIGDKTICWLLAAAGW